MSQGPFLGLLFLAVLATAPWWVRRLRPGGAETTVRVLGRTALSRNATVAVVEIGGRRLLVGAAEHGVSVLTELDPEDGTDAALASPSPAPLAATPELLTEGPRIGPLDRLRAMTVRTTPPGRPIRVPLRR